MDNLLLIIHIVVCLFLVVIVLLQHGKGADIGATFGGSSQSLFGTEGPLPLLNKITTAAAIIFMLTSVTLAYTSARKSRSSVMQDVTQVEKVMEKQPETVKEVPQQDVPREVQKETPAESKPAASNTAPPAGE